MQKKLYFVKARFNRYSRSQKLLGGVLGFLIVGAFLLVVFGDGLLSMLIQGVRQELVGTEPVRVSEFQDKVAPHRRAIIAKFKYNPQSDALISDGVEETYLEVPPLDAALSADDPAYYTFQLSLTRAGEPRLKGWARVRKDALKADARGEVSIRFFLPHEVGSSLEVTRGNNTSYLARPLEIR